MKHVVTLALLLCSLSAVAGPSIPPPFTPMPPDSLKLPGSAETFWKQLYRDSTSQSRKMIQLYARELGIDPTKLDANTHDRKCMDWFNAWANLTAWSQRNPGYIDLAELTKGVDKIRQWACKEDKGDDHDDDDPGHPGYASGIGMKVITRAILGKEYLNRQGPPSAPAPTLTTQAIQAFIALGVAVGDAAAKASATAAGVFVPVFIIPTTAELNRWSTSHDQAL